MGPTDNTWIGAMDFQCSKCGRRFGQFMAGTESMIPLTSDLHCPACNQLIDLERIWQRLNKTRMNITRELELIGDELKRLRLQILERRCQEQAESENV